MHLRRNRRPIISRNICIENMGAQGLSWYLEELVITSILVRQKRLIGPRRRRVKPTGTCWRYPWHLLVNKLIDRYLELQGGCTTHYEAANRSHEQGSLKWLERHLLHPYFCLLNWQPSQQAHFSKSSRLQCIIPKPFAQRPVREFSCVIFREVFRPHHLQIAEKLKSLNYEDRNRIYLSSVKLGSLNPEVHHLNTDPYFSGSSVHVIILCL